MIPDIVADPRLIKSSSLPGVPGNGDIARKLARLRLGPLDEPDASTVFLGDAFNSCISRIGVKTQEAIRMTENQVVLENLFQNRKESISGVSLDEELANMIRFQHAYNAAARMMTAVDETLDTFIIRIGIVGR